ncbi:hypothetical protein NDU88_002060 [Pleurodeles waltl]|uniref:Uncharacterized protein n=1 Tax=Pleurodeles waltl TaxID=8319 RepID=A0AAV7T113_PLEWA|nr:hypothetical protein NDU88_002060 [Pleurodeles waltl]
MSGTLTAEVSTRVSATGGAGSDICSSPQLCPVSLGPTINCSLASEFETSIQLFPGVPGQYAQCLARQSRPRVWAMAVVRPKRFPLQPPLRPLHSVSAATSPSHTLLSLGPVFCALTSRQSAGPHCTSCFSRRWPAAAPRHACRPSITPPPTSSSLSVWAAGPANRQGPRCATSTPESLSPSPAAVAHSREAQLLNGPIWFSRLQRLRLGSLQVISLHLRATPQPQGSCSRVGPSFFSAAALIDVHALQFCSRSM